MAISFLASAAGVNGSTGGSVTVPATVQEGDRLIVCMEINSITGYVTTPPDDWTTLQVFVGANAAPGGSTINYVFTKVASGSDASKFTNFVVEPTGSVKTLGLVAYRGTATTPQVMASALLPFTGTASTSVAVPVLSVAALPTTLVTSASVKSGTSTYTFTPPSGFTQRVTYTTNGNAIAIADAAAGATGNTSVAAWVKSVSSAAGAGTLIALAEGEAPVQKQPVFRRLTVDGWYPAIEA